LNLFTYKWHALGDYVRAIRLFGPTDGFSTQVVSKIFSMYLSYSRLPLNFANVQRPRLNVSQSLRSLLFVLMVLQNFVKDVWVLVSVIEEFLFKSPLPMLTNKMARLNDTLGPWKMVCNVCSAKLPPFWRDAVCTSQYLRNRLPTSVLPASTTPFEAYHGHKPGLSHLRVWGCQCFVLIPLELHAILDGLPGRLGVTCEDGRGVSDANLK
jgi:hypothetical protein